MTTFRTGVSSALLLLSGAALGWWAADRVLQPPDDVLAAPEYTMVEARHGTVGRSISLRASAEWVPVADFSAPVDGVVTEVHIAQGELSNAGDQLLSINLRPVTVAQGEIPMFRSLSEGQSGEDVAQVQDFLSRQGYDSGDDGSGQFGAGTDNAVRRWQEESGYPVSGVVEAGDLLFIPNVPARLNLDSAVGVGSRVGPGQSLVRSLAPDPSFEVVLPEGQLALVQPGQEVVINVGDRRTWSARVADVAVEGEGGDFTAALEPLDSGGSICGDECDQVRTDSRELFPSTIVIEPEQSGVVVPTSAVVTSADGQQAVIGDDGAPVGVRVLGSSQGLSLVDGLQPGALVRAPGLLPSSSTPSSSARGDSTGREPKP